MFCRDPERKAGLLSLCRVLKAALQQSSVIINHDREWGRVGFPPVLNVAEKSGNRSANKKTRRTETNKQARARARAHTHTRTERRERERETREREEREREMRERESESESVSVSESE